MSFTDLAVERDSEGIYDLVIEDGDFKKTSGMDSAIFVSLFTDRRANPDEVADPMKRRGWCGTINTPNRQGNRGSGLWMYEQRRDDVTAGVRMECHQALNWLLTDRLANNVKIETKNRPADRSLDLKIRIIAANGGEVATGYQLWNATPRRTLKV